MNKTSTLDRIVGILDEMEYAVANQNLVTVTLTCDYCPEEWEINAPADWIPSGELTCDLCQDEWQHFELGGEDAYLDTYWESLYE